MGGQVEAAAAEVHRQADHLVQRVATGEDHERPEPPDRASKRSWLVMRQVALMARIVVRYGRFAGDSCTSRRHLAGRGEPAVGARVPSSGLAGAVRGRSW